jgi:hypothetical protein
MKSRSSLQNHTSSRPKSSRDNEWMTLHLWHPCSGSIATNSLKDLSYPQSQNDIMGAIVINKWIPGYPLLSPNTLGQRHAVASRIVSEQSVQESSGTNPDYK